VSVNNVTLEPRFRAAVKEINGSVFEDSEVGERGMPRSNENARGFERPDIELEDRLVR
jgi:hypothetical protein